MELAKVILRYMDGRVVKGLSRDFYPDRDRFHLLPCGRRPGEEMEIPLKDLKAVFIVRDFKGNPQHPQRQDFSRESKIRGQKVEVTFFDGEILVGTTLGPAIGLKRKGFFFFPADAQSNILRAFLFSSAVREVRGPPADGDSARRPSGAPAAFRRPYLGSSHHSAQPPHATDRNWGSPSPKIGSDRPENTGNPPFFHPLFSPTL